jgi:2-oxoglutarate dehydrogenase E2 component (dihydrolipoamide succinyltransferase)
MYPSLIRSIADGITQVYHEYADVSVAVGTPTGLVVPVLRNAENMSFAQVCGSCVRCLT